ncbi:MAG TPA: DNA polymerase IV, partial [Bacilli bacterium]|nr:DNA polymerase IV [Bacilli bacterium]
IMHIDLNAFFATAEVIRNPALANKPLVVGGTGRRGIVSTASYEARAFGIHSAMPTYMAERLCPNLIILPSDFKLYSRLSREFFDFVRHYTSLIEIASIDECYADMTETLKNVKNPIEFLTNLQKDLYEKTKLKCSIGIGPTKFLAKMASDYQKPMGLTIFRRRDLAQTLWKLPIKSMYGVGKKTYPRLEKIGIHTIGDLATSESEEVKNLLGKFYFTLKEWVTGYGSDEVNPEPDDPKSIGNSRTLASDTDDYDEIRSMIIYLCQEVSERAQAEKMLGSTIQIVLKNSDFSTINRSITLEKPTNDLGIIYLEAMRLFDKNYQGQMIRLVGVTLANLVAVSEVTTQLSLFDSTITTVSKTEQIIQNFNKITEKPLLKRLSDIKVEASEDKSDKI